MLVSVVIPIYNAAPYLRETVESVFQSTYRPLEVVMVDDGSTDDSLNVAKQIAAANTNDNSDFQCRLFTQANAGVSAARNHAIREAKGEYILPLDADDLLGRTYIDHAVGALSSNPRLRIVGCRARMFGDTDKEWKLPSYSPERIARKNMIPVSSLFRRADWEQAGGFCEEDIYREDWDFWLSLLELDMAHPERHRSAYLQLEETGLYYRVHKGSRRIKAKAQKQAIVDAINRRHPRYVQHYLGGPLHYCRSLSKWLNMFRTERVVQQSPGTPFPDRHEGIVLYSQRNTLLQNGNTIIKRFAVPPLWRGLLYGWFIPSKAQRSYEYALRLGAFTPPPIAYREVKYLGILRESTYVCEKSPCRHTFNELIGNPSFPHRKEILRAIGKFTAQLHLQGCLHGDYSGGNILFNDDGTLVQVIDLNRIRWTKSISTDRGLRNFERLNIDKEALATMAQAYAETMGLEPDYCTQYIVSHRWHKHVKQGITNL